MKNYIKKICVIILVFLLSFNFKSYSNVDIKDEIKVEGIIDTPSNSLNVYSNSASSSITSKKIKSNYDEYIYKLIEDSKHPFIANLPTLLRQNSFHPTSNDYFGRGIDKCPIFSVKVEENDEKRYKCIGLTFDSAYINDFTYKILDILDKYDAKATFFMTKDYMLKNLSQVEDIVLRGHEIGNHSSKHPNFNLISDEDVIKEVMENHNYVSYNLGINMCLFRFPFGSYSPRTVSLLKKMGYYPIQWTFDSVDWKNESLDALINRFKSNEEVYLNSGNIILFHNGATYTPEFLPIFFEKLNEKGFRAVKVSDLIYDHNFQINSSGMQLINEDE